MTETRAGSDRFVLLATVGDLASAHLWAARLDAEGIETRVHGPALGPYPVTVGQMAASEIWVLESRVDEARLLLLEVEVDHVLEAAEPGTAQTDPSMRVTAALLAIVVVILVARAVLWVV